MNEASKPPAGARISMGPGRSPEILVVLNLECLLNMIKTSLHLKDISFALRLNFALNLYFLSFVCL